MSISAERWARAQKKVGSSAKEVLKELAYCHNARTGLCNPSIRYLMDATELAEATVLNATKKLESEGLISKRYMATSIGRCIQYVLVGFNPKDWSEGIKNEDIPSSADIHKSEDTQEIEGIPKTEGTGIPKTEGTGIPKTEGTGIPKTGDITGNTTGNITGNIEVVGDFALTSTEKNEPKKRKTQPKPVTHEFTLTALPDEWRELCKRTCPELDPDRTFENFRFYWTQGKGKGTRRSEKGWASAWQNWVKREAERGWKPPNNKPKPLPKFEDNGDPYAVDWGID